MLPGTRPLVRESPAELVAACDVVFAMLSDPAAATAVGAQVAAISEDVSLGRASSPEAGPSRRWNNESSFFFDNLHVRIHFIVEMIWGTGLAQWEFKFNFPSSLMYQSVRHPLPSKNGSNAKC